MYWEIVFVGCVDCGLYVCIDDVWCYVVDVYFVVCVECDCVCMVIECGFGCVVDVLVCICVVSCVV